jgi:biotin operon repressor
MKSLRTLQKREKVFARPKGMPLDRNAKARIIAAANAYNARHKTGRQHRGPLTRVTLDVLQALLWCFHNSRAGDCFPSYETIAAKAGCCRDSVCVAIKALEEAGLMTWVNCLTKIRKQGRDLFGQMASYWQVIRTSNFYLFRDPLPCAAGPENHKSENPPGTLNQDISNLEQPVKIIVLDTKNPLDAALARFGRSAGYLPAV